MCNTAALTAALTAHAPHLAALDALGRELLLVALGAVDVMLLGEVQNLKIFFLVCKLSLCKVQKR